ncbi:MAG: MBL fold metallo-hydrolase [bacterium]|nr:MBL fold metallo-hydrolase [bacterium]
MVIQYHGDACVRVSGKIGPQEYTVLFDPYDAKATGLKPIRPSSVDLVATTTGALPEFGDGPYRVTGPGEYEAKGVMVTGIAVGGRTIYRMQVEELSLAHLGNLAAKLDEATLEQLGDVHVLLVPVGGKTVLSAKQAAEVIEQIEPRIVIPIQYKLPGASLPYDGIEAFCKEMGVSAKAPEEKLKVTDKDLPQEEMWVKVMAVS